MKKVVLIGGFLIGGAIAYASQMGPYGYDERGAQISTGLGIFQTTASALTTLNPAFAGQMVVCNNCTLGTGNASASNPYNLCIASGTGQGAWVEVSTPTLVCK